MTGGTAAPRLAVLGSDRTVQRLRSARDIRRVFASRCAAASPIATVHALRRPDNGPARLTVTAGRNVGNAVARNRVKRRLRGALLETAIPAGGDFVVVGRAAALDAAAARLRGDLGRLVAAAWARCA